MGAVHALHRKTLARIRKHRQQRQVLRLTVQGQTEPVRLLRQKAPALPGREAEPQMRRVRGNFCTAEASKTVGDSSFVKFAMFGDNVIKYTKDGASYIDASGKTIWTQSYEMKTPIININGDYAVIADQQGNEMYICSKEGCTGTAKTQLPITKAAVSARGVAAAVVEDSTASYMILLQEGRRVAGDQHQDALIRRWISGGHRAFSRRKTDRHVRYVHEKWRSEEQGGVLRFL